MDSNRCNMVGVSTQSLYGYSLKTGFADPRANQVPDDELDEKVRLYKRLHPNCGESMLRGYLNSLKVFVTRKRLRQSVSRVEDVVRRSERLAKVIHRRQYKVPFANYLWHCDLYCKLSPVNIWVIGGVDGFSRKICFIQGFLRAVQNKSQHHLEVSVHN
eukprot:TRINITY_DN3875_c0_g1_i10.p1 TRINITY_DN3875_c0_g1~~TRINITY_DN3875_c0_g1_i10.p1  ORF type:complete len:159 (-),score=9.88 TRINITY_DN3875_c0_g1_i10:1020-1496(-)